MPGALPEGDPAPVDGRLPAQAALGSETRSLHAYLHIPFCAARCGYCDFNTYTADELPGASQAGYPRVIESEIRFASGVLEHFPERPVRSVFFGGGTPTLLPSNELANILVELKRHFPIANEAEVTTEANPDSVDACYLEALATAGFTRVSFGMQSAVPSVLSVLERTHEPKRVPDAVRWAKEAGLKTSVDLIYGTPGETIEEWKASVEAAVALETDHISAYSLIVEPGTKLARQIAAGKVARPSDDLAAEMYQLAKEIFARAGFENYEISNFAKSPDERSTHNLAYWKSQDWWGFGPGAHSHFGGVRWWNHKHPGRYAEALAAGHSPAAAREVLDEQTRLLERVLLELRTSEGVPSSVLMAQNPRAAAVIAAQIAAKNIDGRSALAGQLVLTERGRMLADAVIRDLVA